MALSNTAWLRQVGHLPFTHVLGTCTALCLAPPYAPHGHPPPPKVAAKAGGRRDC